MDKRKWTYRVQKSAKGGDGNFFGYGTAATFMSLEEADLYAGAWAKRQSVLTGPIEIDVIRRRGDDAVITYRVDHNSVERVVWRA